MRQYLETCKASGRVSGPGRHPQTQLIGCKYRVFQMTASLDAEKATPSESTEAVSIEIVQDVVTPNDKTKSTLLEPVAAQEIVSERTPQSVAMETDETKAAAAIEEKNVISPMKKKKKKKKNNYKDMMSGIMAPTRSEEEARKEYEEKMKQTLGGGEFSKLDKI